MASLSGRRSGTAALLVLVGLSFCAAHGCGDPLNDNEPTNAPVRDSGAGDDGGGTSTGDAGVGDAAGDGPSTGCPDPAARQSDGENCGACGISCRGGKCTNGICAPTVLAMSTTPLGIAVDTTHVYWTSSTTPGAIMRIAKAPDAKMPEVFEGNAGALPDGIDVDTTNGVVYWVAGSKVYRKASAGGTAPTTADAFVSSSDLRRVQVAPDKVWFTAHGGSNAGLFFADLDLNVVTPFELLPNAVPFHVDVANTYLVNWDQGEIHRYPGNTLRTGFSSVRAFAVNEATNDVWWTFLGGVAHTTPAAFDAPSGVIDVFDSNIATGGIVYDAKRGAPFYITALKVKRVDGTSTPVAVADAVCGSPGVLAQDDDALYWTCPPTNQVWRWTKPPP